MIGKNGKYPGILEKFTGKICIPNLRLRIVLVSSAMGKTRFFFRSCTTACHSYLELRVAFGVLVDKWLILMDL